MSEYEFRVEGFNITQLQEIADLIKGIAYNPERVPELDIERLTIALDPSTGDMYVRDDEGVTAALNGKGEVEQSFYLSGTELEGFYDDLVLAFENGYVTREDDLEELKDIAELHKDDERVGLIETALKYDELLYAAKTGKLHDENELVSLETVARYRDDADALAIVGDALKSVRGEHDKTRSEADHNR